MTPSEEYELIEYPITVRCEPTGDVAHCDTEMAVSTARQLMEDARAGGCRIEPTCSFYVLGKAVRVGLTLRNLSGFGIY